MGTESEALPKLVAVGRFGRPHGVKGEIRLDPMGTMPRGLAGYSRFYTSDRRGVTSPFLIASWRTADDALLLKIPGIDDRDEVGKLTGLTLMVPRDDLPALKEGEYYHTDLINAPLEDESGAVVGKVTDVKPWGDYDMLIVRTGQKTWMLPVISQYVLEIHTSPARLVVRVPEGLGP